MKTTRTLTIGLALCCVLSASSVQASLTIDYSVGAWGPQNYQLNPAYPGDTVSMLAYSGSGLVLPDNTAVTAQINTFLFNVNYSDDGSYGSVDADNFIASRLMTITAPAAGGQTLSQNGVLNVTANFDYVDIQNGLPIVFNFAGVGTVTVTPLGLSTGQVGDLGDHFYDVTGTFLFTPVPEATTMIAGTLLLLPFAGSTLRILRKSRAA
jgi:long-subunit fatty acid transport protein